MWLRGILVLLISFFSIQLFAQTPTLTIVGTSQETCDGSGDATVTFNITDGTPGYAVSILQLPSLTRVKDTTITTPGVDFTLSGFGAGAYFLIVSDANSFPDQETFIINATAPITVTETINDVSCPNDVDGSILLTIPSETPAYTYQWYDALNNPIATTRDLTNVGPQNYTVDVTDEKGCLYTFSYDIIAINDLVADFTLPADTCMGVNFVVADNSSGDLVGANYEWTFGADATPMNSTLAGSPSVAFSTVGTKTVKLKVDNGTCADSIEKNLDVLALPAIDAGSDQSICLGDTVQLSATTADVFLGWTPIIDIEDETNATTDVYPSSTQKYFAEAEAANGCVSTDSVTITVNPLPTAGVTPLDPTICEGDSVQLIASGGISYVWSPATGLDDPNIANPYAKPTATTSYLVTVTDANGCQDTISTTVTVNPIPTVNAVATPNVICVGETVNLSTDFNALYSYSWSSDNATPVSDPSIFNPTTQPTNNTVYKVVVDGGNGCVDSSTVSVTVNALPTVTVTPFPSDTICKLEEVQLTAAGGVSYDWFPKDGTLDDDAIANPKASPVTDTEYKVLVTDANGCIDSASTTIYIDPIINITLPGNDTICLGDNVTINASATNAMSYSWSPLTDVVSGANTSTLEAQPTVTRTYTVTVTNNINCTNEDSIQIVVIDPLPVVVTPDTSTCLGDSVLLTADVGVAGYSYSWSPTTDLSDPNSNVTYALGNSLGNTTYTVTATSPVANCPSFATVDVLVNDNPTLVLSNDTAICIGDTASLSVSGANSYLWSPAASLNTNTGADVKAYPSSDQYFTVVGTNLVNCTTEDSVLVTVNPLPVITTSASPNPVCAGSTTQLTASPNTLASYSWVGGDLNDSTLFNPLATPLSSRDYVVFGTDANACSSSDTLSVIVDPIPVVTTSSDTAICVGDTIQLSVALSSGDVVVWSPSVNIDDVNSATPRVSPNADQAYTATVTNASGCSASSDVLVKVNLLPTGVVSLSADTICFGDTATINAALDGTFVLNPLGSYSFDGGATFAPKDSLVVIGNVAGDQNTQVVLKDINGCRSLPESVDVHVLDPVDFVFTVLSQADCSSPTGEIEISNPTGGKSPYTYSKDGGAAQAFTGVVNFPNLGVGTHTVLAEDSKACSVTKSVTFSDAITFDEVLTEPLCFGDSNGEVELANVTGGLAPYEYSLNTNTAYGPSAVFSGLAAGTYTIYVRDATACEIPVVVTLDQPDEVVASIDVLNDIYCKGDTGQVQISVTGGSAPYSVSSTVDSFTGNGPFTFNDLPTGTHTINVLDALNCPASIDVDVVKLPELNTSLSATGLASCKVDSGSAQIDFTLGASGDYAYSFEGVNSYKDSLAFSSDLQNLAAGIHSVVTRDEVYGCLDTTSVVITKVDGIDVTQIVTDVEGSCTNTDGTISLSNFVGNAPRPYRFELRDFATNGVVVAARLDSNFTGLGAGSYRVVIYDTLDCTEELPVTVPDSDDLDIVVDTTHASCGNANGEISLTISGGVAPYSVSFNDKFSFGSATVFTGLAPAIYDIYVLDSSTPLNCEDSVQVEIRNEDVKPTGQAIAVQDTICFGSTATVAAMLDPAFVENVTGSYSFDNGATFGVANSIVFTPQNSGDTIINVVLRDAVDCALSDPIPVLVHVLDPITFNVDTPMVPSCLSEGSLLFDQFAGGTGNLTYSINGGAFEPVKDTLIDKILPGIYSILVLDDRLCNASEVIDLKDPLKFNSVYSNPLCQGEANGLISFSNLSGGVAPYEFSFNDTLSFGPDSVFTGLAAGNYTVYIRDAADCIIPIYVTLLDPSGVNVVQTAQIDPTCLDLDLGGSMILDVSGGVAPLTLTAAGQSYTGPGSVRFDSLTAGLDTVIITDANGCLTEFPFEVNSAPFITTHFSVVQNGLCSGEVGKAVIDSTIGGSGTYSYQYLGDPVFVDELDMEEQMDSLPLGVFTVVTQDDLLFCKDTSTFTITRAGGVDSVDVISLNSCNDVEGSLELIRTYNSNPPQPYTYEVQDAFGAVVQGPKSDSLFTGLSGGSYVFVVNDAAGCSDYFPVSIAAPSPIAFSQNTVFTDCGQDNGAIHLDGLSNGKGTYTFELVGVYPPQLDSSFIGLGVGLYEIQVTDQSNPVCTTTVSSFIGTLGADAILSVTGASCVNSSDGIITIDSLWNADTLVYDYQFAIDGVGPFVVDTVFDSLSTGFHTLYILQIDKVTMDSCVYTDYNWQYDLTIGGVYYDSIYTNLIPIVGSDSLQARIETEPSHFESATGVIRVLDVYGGVGPYEVAFENQAFSPFVNVYEVGGLNQNEIGTRPPYSLFLRDSRTCVQEISVIVPTDFYVPNIITPNGDGKNDGLTILGLPVGTRVRIFDRWGVLVYENYAYDNASRWTAEGQKDGTFYYEIQTLDGTFHAGWVQVVR